MVHEVAVGAALAVWALGICGVAVKLSIAISKLAWPANMQMAQSLLRAITVNVPFNPIELPISKAIGVASGMPGTRSDCVPGPEPACHMVCSFHKPYGAMIGMLHKVGLHSGIASPKAFLYLRAAVTLETESVAIIQAHVQEVLPSLMVPYGIELDPACAGTRRCLRGHMECCCLWLHTRCSSCTKLPTCTSKWQDVQCSGATPGV
jgi:hypothetical protein